MLKPTSTEQSEETSTLTFRHWSKSCQNHVFCICLMVRGLRWTLRSSVTAQTTSTGIDLKKSMMNGHFYFLLHGIATFSLHFWKSVTFHYNYFKSHLIFQINSRFPCVHNLRWTLVSFALSLKKTTHVRIIIAVACIVVEPKISFRIIITVTCIAFETKISCPYYYRGNMHWKLKHN